MTRGNIAWSDDIIAAKMERIRKRHRRTIQFADLYRAGWSTRSIADQAGISQTRVYQIMAAGCPPLDQKPHRANGVPSRPRILDGPRPDWSYPDEITLRIVREARAEIEAATAPPFNFMETR